MLLKSKDVGPILEREYVGRYNCRYSHAMATIAIGDIHGNFEALDDLLSRVEPELRPDDTLVFLGDYIDRGPDSKGCVERILRLRNAADFRVVALLGNHEQWMLRSLHDPSRHSWLVGMEGMDTVKSYSEEAATVLTKTIEEYGARMIFEKVRFPYEVFFDAMPAEHLRFFEELAPCHRTPDVVCVHGGADLNGDIDPSEVDVHVWGPLGFPEEYAGTDAVVYGHHNNAIMAGDGTALPRIASNRTYGIDTISHGVLTAMRFPDEKTFQSSSSRPSADKGRA
jgi:serine/threonine protein phosphatase 1